jgi:DNA-directed RNA polymerase specialized sigma24 family protein
MDQALTHRPMLLRAARRLTRDDPEDLVQDLFVALCERPPATVNQTYLLTGLRLRLVDRLRRDGCHAPAAMVLTDWTPAWVEGPERAACDRETLREVAALRGGDLALAAAAGWREADIASRTGLSAMTVKKRLYRLRHGPLARISPW